MELAGVAANQVNRDPDEPAAPGPRVYHSTTLSKAAGSKHTSSDLAWLRATCPDASYRDGKQAVTGATKACELSEWKNANAVDTLAAAYAETGQFDKAVEWQQKAIDLAPKEDTKEKGRRRLELYKAGKPYREELEK